MKSERSDDFSGSKNIPFSGDATLSLRIDGTIFKWNNLAEKIFGYTAIEAKGKKISILFSKKDFEKETKFLYNIIQGNTLSYQSFCKIKSGKRVLISFCAFPIKDKKGNVIGISKIAKDISAQKEAEKKQSILAAIITSSEDVIISKTLNGIITSWNNSAWKMFGYTEKEVLGKHISIIIPKDRLAEEKKIIDNIKKGKRINHFETERIAKDGSKKFISLTVSPIKNSKGKIIGASKVARDISVRLETERQRDLYTKRLQELNKYKDEFMVMASHELKTPLTVIMANLHVLSEVMEEENYNTVFIKNSVRQVEKLSDLVNDLLDVSKIVAGKLALNFTLFDLQDLVYEVVNNLQQITKNHTIVFNKNTNRLMVNADKERIGQVIINILGNAIKYSKKQGKIIVNAFEKEGNVEVNVTDQGIGIPPK
ncbi:MAG TPA: PAS domain S-box protein, partial [Hanamia sp.]|nr:PAS domain S-box protein [Hanamia sp.]